MVDSDPGQPNSARNLASATQLHARGELDDAACIYEELLQRTPGSARLLTSLGLLRLQQGRLDDAMALVDRALAVDPAAAEAHGWRGEILRRQRALEPAIDAFHAALARDPDLAPALFNLALAEAERGNRNGAREAWLKFGELRPADRRVCRELGRLAWEQGDFAGAAHWFARQLERTPDDDDVRCDLAAALLRQGAFDAARTALDPVVARQPAHGRALRQLGQALLGCRERREALDVLRRAAAIEPDNAETAFQTGLALDRLARLDEALEWFGKAASLAPKRASIRSAMGVARFNLGEHPRAIAHYREALALDSGFAEAHSNLLMALHHLDPPDHEGVFAEHLAWVARHASVEAMPRAAFANERDPRRRLKIGYVSPRFCGGPLAHFFLPLLEAHDHGSVHVTCYAVSTLDDDQTAAMRAHADAWRDAATHDDEALVELIRGDGIDILVDLAGHCPGHRLGVFARRGAPVQFTWMDYVGTTGLPTMDYLVTDALHTPVGTPQRYTERVLRLPDTRLCYRPTRPLPTLSPSPAAERGFVTFGCFNRLNKLGPEVVATWSEILSRVPRSRLVLKATAFEAEETRAVVRRRFERHGIDPRRLDLKPYSAEVEMMREYAEIDVVLDPFPYNGCTTTCDALVMGVPVVTLPGTTLPGRHGVALLTACGLAGNVAQSRDEYIEFAVRAARSVGISAGNSVGSSVGRSRGASDPGSVAARAALRERFLNSPAADGPRFARAFERLYRDTWRAWCERGE